MDEGTLLFAAIAVAVVGALYVSARRATTIADLDVRDGRLEVVRGGIAPPVLADLRDIARTPAIARARIRIVRASGRADVSFHGTIAPEQAQRIRNVVGSVPLARLINAKRR